MANVEQIIIKDSGGTEADVTASNALKVDGSAVTQPVSGTVTINAIPAGTNNIGDVDVLSLPALPAGTNAIGKLAANDGVDIGDVTINNTSIPVTDNSGSLTVDAPVGTPVFTRLSDGAAALIGQKTKANSLPVAIASDQDTLAVSLASVPSHAVTNAGTFAVQASLNAGTNNIGDVDVLTLPGVAGDVAHDTGDSGNPVKVGAKAANALPTAVSNGDRTNNISDLWGRQLFSHIDPAMQVAITKTAFNATTTQTGAAMWTPASGKKIAITSMTISSYGTTAARVIIWIGASGDTTYTAGTDHAVVIASFAPSATVKPGLVLTPAVPIFSQTADHILKITTDAGISIDVTFSGYEF